MGTLSSVKAICGRLHHPEDQFWWVQWDPIFERSPIWEVDHVWHPGKNSGQCSYHGAVLLVRVRFTIVKYIAGDELYLPLLLTTFLWWEELPPAGCCDAAPIRSFSGPATTDEIKTEQSWRILVLYIVLNI